MINKLLLGVYPEIFQRGGGQEIHSPQTIIAFPLLSVLWLLKCILL